MEKKMSNVLSMTTSSDILVAVSILAAFGVGLEQIQQNHDASDTATEASMHQADYDYAVDSMKRFMANQDMESLYVHMQHLETSPREQFSELFDILLDNVLFDYE